MVALERLYLFRINIDYDDFVSFLGRHKTTLHRVKAVEGHLLKKRFQDVARFVKENLKLEQFQFTFSSDFDGYSYNEEEWDMIVRYALHKGGSPPDTEDNE